MPFASINGINIYYETQGSERGDTILFLHGGGSTIHTYDEIIKDLKQQFRIFTYETRGHGRSQDIHDQDYTYDLLMQDVKSFIQEIAKSPVHIVGWSDGAIIAMNLAMNHPQFCKKLILIGANYHRNGLEPKFADELIACNSEDDWTVLLGADSVRMMKELSPHGSDHFLSAVCPKLKRLWLSEPTWTEADLARIPHTALLVAGDDECIRIEHTVEMLRKMPLAQLCILPATTHMIHEEKPQLVARILAEFLVQASAVKRSYI